MTEPNTPSAEAMPTKKQTDKACDQTCLLVVVNGVFGIEFQKKLDDPSDAKMLIYTPRMDQHLCAINHLPFSGDYILQGVKGSSNVEVFADYGFAPEQVMTLDCNFFPRDTNIPPLATLTVPPPDAIIPHRHFCVTFRDGSGVKHHFDRVPGALILVYYAAAKCKKGPVVWNGLGDTIDPMGFGANNYPTFYVCSAHVDMDQPPKTEPLHHTQKKESPDHTGMKEPLDHSKKAWRRLARHAKSFSYEMLQIEQHTGELGCKDSLCISDQDIEDGAKDLISGLLSKQQTSPQVQQRLTATVANCSNPITTGQ